MFILPLYMISHSIFSKYCPFDDISNLFLSIFCSLGIFCFIVVGEYAKSILSYLWNAPKVFKLTRRLRRLKCFYLHKVVSKDVKSILADMENTLKESKHIWSILLYMGKTPFDIKLSNYST